jgi:hydroxymethylglutaryl-CoA lyase
MSIHSSRCFITECPRDAMQGLTDFVPTETKIQYLNTLLKTGFDRLDFGSFVSPKAIPQMRDTEEVLINLEVPSQTRLIAIVANLRGVETVTRYPQIAYAGYPFSVSETFQLRNTNSTISTAYDTVKEMQDKLEKSGQKLIIYISMAFGNPYGDSWSPAVVTEWIDKLSKLGITEFALADTVGVATPDAVGALLRDVINTNENWSVGAHLHCRPDNWQDKVDAAFTAGCRRFDSAMRGMGGCPMAKDELTGNLATESLVQYLQEKNVETQINLSQFNQSLQAAGNLFSGTAIN